MKSPEPSLKNLPLILFRIFTSYGLVVVVLFFMLVLTLLGTLAQTTRGIYDVVEAYFDSAFVVHRFEHVFGTDFSFPLPLPGAYLLMVILFINLLCGAIIKARKDWRRPGMLVAHGGILLLLLGGMVSTHYSDRGFMQLFESGQGNEFVSFIDWQVEIVEAGEDGKPSEALVIPPKDLGDIRQDEKRTFKSAELPFEFVVNGYARNARPLPVGQLPAGAAASRMIDGFVLNPIPAKKEAEQNVPGLYAEFRPVAGGVSQEAILWGGALAPYTLTMGDRKFAVTLTKQKWEMPFTVRLDEFTAVYHPGSDIPAKFESHITKIEDGVEEKVKIWMNHPLRHEGYTFFQRSFGSEEPDVMTGRQFSVFDVVRNPADQWPLYSLIVVGLGLLAHFLQKLGSYLAKASANRAATS